MDELTKSQKKKVRELIDIALKRDCVDVIRRAKEICDSFLEGKSDPKEFYMKLHSTVENKDKDIARRYDDLTGSQYFMRLSMLLKEGVLTEEDVQGLDAELKGELKRILKYL